MYVSWFPYCTAQFLEHTSHYPEWDKWNTIVELTFRCLHNHSLICGFQVFVTEKKKIWKRLWMLSLKEAKLLKKHSIQHASTYILVYLEHMYCNICVETTGRRNEVLCFSRITKWVIMNYCNFHWFNSSTISSQMWLFLPMLPFSLFSSLHN